MGRRRESTTGTLGVLHGGRGGNWQGLHSENKTFGGQSGMVWSVRFLDIFFITCFFPLDCIMFPIPSSSLKREGGMGGDTTHKSGHVFLLDHLVYI